MSDKILVSFFVLCALFYHDLPRRLQQTARLMARIHWQTSANYDGTLYVSSAFTRLAGLLALSIDFLPAGTVIK